MDRFALQIARITNICFRCGFNQGVRRSANLRAEKARAAKRQKADARGHILRRAIVFVCVRQNLTPIASEKFASSIQSEVIEAARQFGLTDLKSGTSARSIQRHIAAILKHGGMS